MRQTPTPKIEKREAAAAHTMRCVQTGGSSGPITQGRFNGTGIYLPSGIWAWSIDDRYVPGKLIDQHPQPPRAPTSASAQGGVISEVAA